MTALQKIPFDGDTIDVLRGTDGEPLVSLGSLCRTLGLDFSGQLQRLKRQPWAVVGTVPTTAQDGKRYKVAAIDLDTLSAWLVTIQTSLVRPAIQEKLIRYQKECCRVLRQHFFPTAKPAGDEVLAEIDALEQSLAIARKNRLAILENRRRLQAVEERSAATSLHATRAEAKAEAAYQVATGADGLMGVAAYLERIGVKLTEAQMAAHGKALTRLARTVHHFEPGHVSHVRFGKINVYPLALLQEYFNPIYPGRTMSLPDPRPRPLGLPPWEDPDEPAAEDDGAP